MAKQVAEDIVAFCTTCKLDLAHVIVALDGEKVKKVLCNTCNKEHVYKAPKEGKVPSKKRTLTAKSKKKTISPLEEWERAMEQAKDAPIRVYAQDGSFAEGEKVDHSTFGQGLITKLIQPNKMGVIFEDGAKIMIRGSS
ncbi:MAG: hypothetical protein ABIG67_06695 [Pseudomonadota bacterium]